MRFIAEAKGCTKHLYTYTWATNKYIFYLNCPAMPGRLDNSNIFRNIYKYFICVIMLSTASLFTFVSCSYHNNGLWYICDVYCRYRSNNSRSNTGRFQWVEYNSMKWKSEIILPKKSIKKTNKKCVGRLYSTIFPTTTTTNFFFTKIKTNS